MWANPSKLNIALLFLAVATLSACVTTSPDVLLSNSTEPAGQIVKTGNYPVIGQVPKAQTTQITPTEKAAIKADLTNSAKKGSAQAAQDSQSAYNRELVAMRKLAAAEKKKRLAEIESRKY